MNRLLVVLVLTSLAALAGCNAATNSSNSNNVQYSLANPSSTYWESSTIPNSTYQLALLLNSDGSGQCTYSYSDTSGYTAWYAPTNISWTLSGGDLSMANAQACLSPLITGVQLEPASGAPPKSFTGTLDDSGAQYPLTFSLQSGSLP